MQATNHPATGTHDAFRHGPTSAAQTVAAGNASALQARLEKVSYHNQLPTDNQWQSTQLELRQTVQRNNFGVSVPLRQSMEMKLVGKVS